jgi:hypothetical protein
VISSLSKDKNLNLIFGGFLMARSISKNARRDGAQEIISRWGGTIKMKSRFQDGKLKHYAECMKTGNTARKPNDLM